MRGVRERMAMLRAQKRAAAADPPFLLPCDDVKTVYGNMSVMVIDEGHG